MTVARETHPRWGLVALSSVVVLAVYALLIESWRHILATLGGTLQRGDAARIWVVSNLARYLPGYFWQLGAMTEMTRRCGVPVTVSTGAAVITTIVNLCTGFAVAMIFMASSPTLRTLLGAKGTLLIALGVLALLLAPVVAPRLVSLARRVSGRELVIPRFGVRPVLIAAVSTTIAWLAYGVAFWLLTRAVLPGEARALAGCIALYVGSYLVGLLNPAPAGIGAAEGAMVLLAPQLGVATQAEALVLSVIVRIWRTVLEILPGLIALMFGTREPEEKAGQPSRGNRIP